MSKKKILYVIYGVTTELMRAAKAVVPKNAKMLLQNSRFFDPNSLIADAGKVIIVDDVKAELIRQAYGEDLILDIEIDIPEDGSPPDATPAAGTGRNITEVKGLGKKTAEVLNAAGIVTLEDLAALNDDVEVKVAETGIENLADFIAKADELLNDE